MFQFLDGSIKSPFLECLTICVFVFQFLDGSIKRLAIKNIVLTQLCFNSLMVRLKVPHVFFPLRS